MSTEPNELAKPETTSANVSEVSYTSKGTRKPHSSKKARKKSKELSGSQLREETARDEHSDSSAATGRKKSQRKHGQERDISAVSAQSTERLHDSTATRSKKKKHAKPVETVAKETDDQTDTGASATALVERKTEPNVDLGATAPETRTPKESETKADIASAAVLDGKRPEHEPSETAVGRSTAPDISAPGHSRHPTAPAEAAKADSERKREPKRPKEEKRRPRDSRGKGVSKITIAVGLLAAGILLFFILITAIAWVRSQSYAVCNSGGCSLFSRRFRASLNESAANPCDNFTAFVCDGWTRHSEYSVRQKLAVDALDTLSKLSRGVQATANIKTPAEGAMAFFRSCDAVLRGDVNQVLTVKRLLAAANITWPRRPSAPDALQTLLYSSVRLRLSPLFNIEIDATVDYGTDVFFVPFDDSRLLRRKFDSLQGAAEGDRRAYFNSLRDYFVSSTADEIDVTYEEIVNLSESMLVPMFQALQEQSTKEAINTSLLLQANLTTSRWESALALFGVTEKPITYSTEALPYIEKFFELWNAYGENKTHMLVSWCTVQVAALYANRQLIFNYYGSEERALVEHGAFCLSKAFLIAKFALFADYSSHILKKDGRRDLENIAHNVRHAFHSRLQGWKHYERVRTVVDDWDSVATVFSAFDASSGNAANDTQIYLDMGESLPDNWRKAAISLKTMRSDKVFMAIQSLGLHVVLYNDFILLPFSASFPLYYVNSTDAVNYGGIGKEMALSLSGLFYDTYWRFDQANSSIVNVSKCIGGPQALASNLEAVAMNALYDAYMNASAGRDVRLVGLEKYTASQLFFMAACYGKCSGSLEHNNEDCNAALRHVEAFALNFQCPSGAFMNPAEPCRLF